MQPQHKEKFLEVICEPNAISGEEFLVLLEVGFGSGGNQVTPISFVTHNSDHLPKRKSFHYTTFRSHCSQKSQGIVLGKFSENSYNFLG
jgi:hypothetical protein